jgi:hypothetical protein
MEKKAAEDGGQGLSDDSPNGDAQAIPGVGSKRKAGGAPSNHSKKAKGEGAPAVKDPNSNVDEEDDDDYGEEDG